MEDNKSINRQKETEPYFLISVNGSVITDKVSIASYFNSYFTSVADNLLKNIEKSPLGYRSYLKSSIRDSVF